MTTEPTTRKIGVAWGHVCSYVDAWREAQHGHACRTCGMTPEQLKIINPDAPAALTTLCPRVVWIHACNGCNGCDVTLFEGQVCRMCAACDTRGGPTWEHTCDVVGGQRILPCDARCPACAAWPEPKNDMATKPTGGAAEGAPGRHALFDLDANVEDVATVELQRLDAGVWLKIAPIDFATVEDFNRTYIHARWGGGNYQGRFKLTNGRIMGWFKTHVPGAPKPLASVCAALPAVDVAIGRIPKEAMVDEKTRLQVLQEDGIDAAYRTAGSQFVKATRAPIVALLQRHLAPDDEGLRARIAAFLETELGSAVLASMLSLGLGAMPRTAMGDVPERLARELRVRAMGNVGDVVVDVLMDPMREVAATYLRGVPEIGVRVALPRATTPERLEEALAATVAPAPSFVAPKAGA